MSYRYNYTWRRNSISGPMRLVAASDIFHPTSDQKYGLGMKYELNDGTGRIFRYAEDGGAGLSKATMAQSLAAVANWTEQAMTSYTAAVGDQTVQITLATAVAANDLDDGWLCVTDGAPAGSLGDMYLIKSHTTGTTPVLTLADIGGIRTALATTSEVTVIPNQYKDVVGVPAAAATAIPCGVPLVDVTAGYFGWLQTRGPCPLIIDTDDVVVGNPVGETTTANVIGGGGLVANDGTGPVWGWVMAESTSGQADQPSIVYLTLE